MCHCYCYFQDLKVKMESQYEEISQWKPWCLENTLSLLQHRFPGSAIWIVRPCRMLRYLFSCFHNFVQSSIVGIPTYSHGYGALPHIELLLLDAIHQTHSKGQLRLPPRVVFELPLVLIGFSKGCVVLNQVLHELANYVNLDHTQLQVPYHHSSSSSLNRQHRKTPSISSVSSLSSMEDGPTHCYNKPSVSNPQSPITKKKVDVSGSKVDVSNSSSPAMSGNSMHRHPSVSSLSSEQGDPHHRSRSRSPMIFSRSGSSSSTSQGHRVIALSEEDILRLRLLLGRLKAMFWLDAGHSGGCGAWVTDEDLLRCLASLGTEVHVHVTPQQVCDPNRGWIREEERDFVDKLRYYGTTVTETMHFEHEERSLLNHFKLLNVF